ncbi:MAG TPA: hypothetical protein VF520_00760 [Thermoleophilaceae bacterium]|jgi:hypothetical protein
MTSASRTASLRAVARILVLGSGAALAVAGALAASGRWGLAGLVANFAGIATPAGFALRARAERPSHYVGGDRRPARSRARSLAGALPLMIASGGLMFAAGYVGSSVSWLLAGPLVLLAGPVVAAASGRHRHVRSA